MSEAAGSGDEADLGGPILVGVALRDDDAPVLRLAAELASVTGARLVLFHAYPFQPLIALPPPTWVETCACRRPRSSRRWRAGFATPVP